jgi:hypothetical protein
VSTRETSRRLSEADGTRIRKCLLLSSTLYSEVDSFPYGAATAHKDAEKKDAALKGRRYVTC